MADSPAEFASASPARRPFWRSPLFGVAISAALLLLLATQVDLRASFAELRRIEARQLGWPVVFLVAGLSVRPWRWQLIFPPAARPPFGKSFAVWSIANMCNNILPARGGDVLRCFLIAEPASGSSPSRLHGATAALATLGLEKVLDGLALLAVIALSFFFLNPPGWMMSMVLIAGALFGGALAVMIALALWPDFVRRVTLRLGAAMRAPGLAGKLVSLLDSFALGLSAVRSPGRMAGLVLLTALIWAIDMGLVWSCAQALQTPISPWVGALLTAVLGLGMMIPAAPGFVGTYEFFSVAVLSLFAVTREQALALTLVTHAGVLLMTTAFGLAALAASGVRWSALPAARGPALVNPIQETVVHGQ